MNDWWKEAVIYQIYPRSFQDTTGNGVGDIKGIISKVSYLKSLGVDAVWLSPIFTSPMKDMGYDVSHYTSIDPLFGTMQDFDHLVDSLHRNEIKIIIDQVLSHSSNQHEAFIKSAQSKTSLTADWYVWADPKEDGSPPNNWLSVFGGSAWEWEPQRRQYYLHNFLKSQPDFNFHNIEVQKYLLNIVKFWLDKGVDGFRLDTVNYYFHDKSLRDNPISPKEFIKPPVNSYYMQNHIHSINQEENLKFLQSLRKLMDSYSGKTLIGEIGDSHRAIDIMKQYTKDSRLHMSYSFELLGKEFSSAFIRKTIESFFDDDTESWPCWSFSNHDVVRHVSRWDESESEEFAKLTCALLLSFKGTICLYQGEELGQTETKMEYDELRDPPGIRFWPEDKGRDGCRTPMTWENNSIHGGFSKADPWLPVKEQQLAKSANLQERNANSVLNFYKKMIAFRRMDAALSKGNQTFISEENDLLIFFREYKSHNTLCIFNLNKEKIIWSKPDNLPVKNSLSSGIKIKDNHIEFSKFAFMIIQGFKGDLEN
jgi:alpha-glucosidase|tara:strand:- start:4304 stop:5914 length:1611 start_codon:yes stop_codon:yes gene_type:complete